MNQKKRVALYVRVSTAEQADKYGADVQLNQMKKWVAANDLYAISQKHIYIDKDCSGASTIEEREAFPKLFDAARRKEFDVVLVWKLDRFFRKTQYLLNAIAELDELQIGFIATTQPEVNTTGTMGKFMLGLLGLIAEMERDLILERTGGGRVEAADAGKWVGGFFTPYGYDVDPVTQVLSINPVEEKIVIKIFNWFVRDKKKLYEIQQLINSMNIPTKADSKAEQLRIANKLKKEIRTKNPANFWDQATIRRVLKQQAYTGIYYYGKKTTKKDPKTKKKYEIMNPFEKWIPIRCIPIITKEIWEDAQVLLVKNKELSQKNSTREYLLSGRIYCSQCGSPYVGYIQPKWKTKKGVKTRVSEYQNYRCRKNNKVKSAIPCRNRQISGHLIETKVWLEIEDLLKDPKKYIEEVQKQERKESNIAELEADKKLLVKLQTETDAEYQRASWLFEKGLGYQSEGEIEKRLEQYVKDSAKIAVDLNTICSKLLDADARQERIASAKKIAKRYAKSLKKLDFPVKKEIAQTLINRIVIYETEVDVEFAFPKPSKRRISGDSSGTSDRTNQIDLYGVTGQD